jgi:aspartate aminotransferase
MSTSALFASVKDAPLDQITGLDQLFRDDPSPQKFNLVIGVYQDEDGHTPVLDSVKAAEQRLLACEESKAYLPMLGEDAYRRSVVELVFGRDGATLRDRRVTAMHTPGGTAALRIAAEFLLDHFPKAALWLSTPFYPNHPGIFEPVGFRIERYRYYHAASGLLRFDDMMEDLARAAPGDIIVLHGCCHNPSGADLSVEQWSVLARLIVERGLLPVVDLAYLGFAQGVEEDALPLRELFTIVPEGLVLVSFSKNFALYSERAGAVLFVGATQATAFRSAERAKLYARRLYSSPPSHGSRIVATVLNDADLRRRWLAEVTGMRERLRAMRHRFADGLAAHQVDAGVFPAIKHGKGMFALSSLTPAHVEALREAHHVYMLDNGRISIAGMREATMDVLCAIIARVLRHQAAGRTGTAARWPIRNGR